MFKRNEAILPAEILGIGNGDDVALEPEVFERWVSSLSEEDQEGFIHYGGDKLLAKFVCAFDLFSHHKREPKPAFIIRAYAAAYGLAPASTLCRVRAYEAYEHPAVQFLLESFAASNLLSVKDKATPKFGKLLHRVLDDGEKAETLADAVKALDAGTRFLSMMQREGRDRRRRTIVLDAPKPVGKSRVIEQSAGLVDAANSAPDDEPEPE